MRGEAMRRLCNRLTKRGVCLEGYDALEFFARSGDWQTMAYYPLVKSLLAWEIDPAYEDSLRTNLPNAQITIGDSFELAKRNGDKEARFGFIVIDNPQGVYGNGHCEHFDALKLIPSLAKPESIIIFNVNKKPFDYRDKDLWREKREQFYQVKNTEKLSAGFLLSFYTTQFQNLGFSTSFCFEEQRNDEYLSYLVFGLRKNG